MSEPRIQDADTNTTKKRPGSLRRTDPDATLESEVAQENLSSLTLSLKVSFPPLLGKPSLGGQYAGVHFQGATELPANHVTRVERGGSRVLAKGRKEQIDTNPANGRLSPRHSAGFKR